MPIPVTCGQCTTSLNAPDHLAGKVAKCPKCGKAMQIPGAAAAAPAPPAAPVGVATLACPHCQSAMQLLAQHRGLRVNCPTCRRVLTVAPDLTQLLPEAAPPPPAMGGLRPPPPAGAAPGGFAPPGMPAAGMPGAGMPATGAPMGMPAFSAAPVVAAEDPTSRIRKRVKKKAPLAAWLILGGGATLILLIGITLALVLGGGASDWRYYLLAEADAVVIFDVAQAVQTPVYGTLKSMSAAQASSLPPGVLPEKLDLAKDVAKVVVSLKSSKDFVAFVVFQRDVGLDDFFTEGERKEVKQVKSGKHVLHTGSKGEALHLLSKREALVSNNQQALSDILARNAPVGIAPSMNSVIESHPKASFLATARISKFFSAFGAPDVLDINTQNAMQSGYVVVQLGESLQVSLGVQCPSNAMAMELKTKADQVLAFVKLAGDRAPAALRNIELKAQGAALVASMTVTPDDLKAAAALAASGMPAPAAPEETVNE